MFRFVYKVNSVLELTFFNIVSCSSLDGKFGFVAAVTLKIGVFCNVIFL
jgi:hypothetical protein